MLQLSYKVGELLAPKQSLLLEAVREEAPQSTSADDTSQHYSVTHNKMRLGANSKRPSTGSGRVGAGVDVSSNNVDGRASSSNRPSEGGFQALIYMLRSLGSPIQVKPQALGILYSRGADFSASPAGRISALRLI